MCTEYISVPCSCERTAVVSSSSAAANCGGQPSLSFQRETNAIMGLSPRPQTVSGYLSAKKAKWQERLLGAEDFLQGLADASARDLRSRESRERRGDVNRGDVAPHHRSRYAAAGECDRHVRVVRPRRSVLQEARRMRLVDLPLRHLHYVDL